MSLSNFLFFETEIACKVDVFETVESSQSSKRTRTRSPDNKNRNTKRSQGSSSDYYRSNNRVTEKVNTTTQDRNKKQDCKYCDNRDHLVIDCPQFNSLSTTERWNWASSKKVCFRCLISTDHRQNKCREVGCTVTGSKSTHHSLLHRTVRPCDEQEGSKTRDRALRSLGREGENQ